MPELLVPWHWLNTKHKAFISPIIADWQARLDSPRFGERQAAAYLKKYPGLFLTETWKKTCLAIAELELEAALRIDFVVPVEGYSAGFGYELIELQSPQEGPYNSAGRPSGGLNEAMEQVRAWQRWLKSHSELAKELFPGKDYRLYGVLPFSYTVVIGQRKHSPEFIANRNDLSRETGIQIRSFDYLTDKLRERHFWVEMHIFSTEYKRLSDPTRNALANPFYTTFSSSEWRDLIRQDLDITHMTPNNATLILQNRKLNKYDRMFRRLVAGDLGEKTNTEVRELINEFG